MSGLRTLRKADKARLVRRPITAEDSIPAALPNLLPPLRHEVLAGLIPVFLLAGFCFAVAALLGRATGFWEAGLAVFLVILILPVVLVGTAIYRRRKRLSPAMAARRRDLDAGVVDEIRFDVMAAKAFREPEHGSLAFFLKLEDGRVCFCSSDDLPAAGWDRTPAVLPPAEMPGRAVHLIFGTVTGDLLQTRFSGEALSPEAVYVLNDREWPAEGLVSKLAWDGIEARFSASPRSPA